MKIKEYIAKIIINGRQEDMEELSDMFDESLEKLKEKDEKCYEEYKAKLYEMVNGKELTEEMANEWVYNMKPKHEHWTMEETTEAMQKMGYNCDKLEFYVVANMVYNDYYDLVKDNEELALRLANDWLKDEDAKENKLYEYWKHVIKKY